MGRRIVTEKGARKFRDIVFPDERRDAPKPQPARTRTDRPQTPQSNWQEQLAEIRDKLNGRPR